MTGQELFRMRKMPQSFGVGEKKTKELRTFTIFSLGFITKCVFDTIH